MRHITAHLIVAVLLAGCGSAVTEPNTASLGVTAAPVIRLSPASLSFTYYYRRRLLVPASQKLYTTNTGGRTLNWTAVARRWLKISPKIGTAPSVLTVSVDPASLMIGFNGYRPGMLRELITISALAASNTPQTVPVTLFIRYY
jgi:hypothetical protein